MKKQSAGILAFRINKQVEILLVHPGGPFYRTKDEGVWSIPKGEYNNEVPLDVAKREFTEETGNTIKDEEFMELGNAQLKSGKKILAWAVCIDFDTTFISSNTFEIEWPPRSGKMESFPEVDKAEWFSIPDARKKIHPGQHVFLDRLEIILKSKS
ncbi:NUDIX domain-containing protein [Pedobacter sp. P351]|uniref:NUDIX domain-containing protein n=1 Tax=Pedobacter superstes TaxID=3133441 RepID=UPI0030A54C26